MLTRVWLDGRSVQLAKLATLGAGGEADVYELGDGRALKIYKAPDHPDVAGVPALEHAAAVRLREQRDKLRAFPAGLPAHVIKPQDLAVATRGGDDVVGFAMAKVDGTPLYAYAEPRWRRDHPTDANELVAALRHLHLTVTGVHRAGVVIGDFNDCNVLVAGPRCWLIDADSWQFGPWTCAMFSERFVDPRLCVAAAAAPGATGGGVPVLAQRHDVDGDWFAFATMVFRSLLCVGPYGGVFRPADPARRVAQAARPLHRLSVFDPEVVYPKAAVPWQVLPDELIEHLRAVFVDDRRGPFPAALLDRLRFRRCACGVEHARASCPACRTHVSIPAVVVRGRVRATRIDPTSLVPASWEVPHATTAATAAASSPVWIAGGQLWRRGVAGAEPIGQILAGHTRAWVGADLGVGLYRAGGYAVAFLFRPDRRGVADGVAIPRIRGQLLDVHAVVGADRAWLWWHEALAGRHTVHAVAIAAHGDVLGHAEAPADDAGWLAAVRGACAVGPMLFVPTDAGLVRVEAAGGALAVTRTYPDTADFVTAADQLVAAAGGLGVRGARGALHLTLS